MSTTVPLIYIVAPNESWLVVVVVVVHSKHSQQAILDFFAMSKSVVSVEPVLLSGGSLGVTSCRFSDIWTDYFYCAFHASTDSSCGIDISDMKVRAPSSWASGERNKK